MESTGLYNPEVITWEVQACRLSRLLLPQLGMTFDEAFALEPVTHSYFGNQIKLDDQFDLLVAPIWSVTGNADRAHATLSLITTVRPCKDHPQYSSSTLRADRARYHIAENDAWKLILNKAPFQEIMEQIPFTPHDGQFHDVTANEPRQPWMTGREREKWDFVIFFQEGLDLQTLPIEVANESLEAFMQSPSFLGYRPPASPSESTPGFTA